MSEGKLPLPRGQLVYVFGDVSELDENGGSVIVNIISLSDQHVLIGVVDLEDQIYRGLDVAKFLVPKHVQNLNFCVLLFVVVEFLTVLIVFYLRRQVEGVPASVVGLLQGFYEFLNDQGNYFFDRFFVIHQF